MTVAGLLGMGVAEAATCQRLSATAPGPRVGPDLDVQARAGTSPRDQGISSASKLRDCSRRRFGLFRAKSRMRAEVALAWTDLLAPRRLADEAGPRGR